eukprot:5351689-Prymnesium_polylepis.2
MHDGNLSEHGTERVCERTERGDALPDLGASAGNALGAVPSHRGGAGPARKPTWVRGELGMH